MARRVTTIPLHDLPKVITFLEPDEENPLRFHYKEVITWFVEDEDKFAVINNLIKKFDLRRTTHKLYAYTDVLGGHDVPNNRRTGNTIFITIDFKHKFIGDYRLNLVKDDLEHTINYFNNVVNIPALKGTFLGKMRKRRKGAFKAKPFKKLEY